MEQNGIEMILTKAKAADDATLRLHAQWWLTGAVFDMKSYESTFTGCKYSADEINQNKILKERFIQEFKSFLQFNFLIDPNNVFVIDIQSGSVKVRFNLLQPIENQKSNYSVHEYGPLGSKYCEIKEVNKSILINPEDFFDHRYDMDYTSDYYKNRLQQRGKENYYFPYGWKRIGLNLTDYFSYYNGDNLNWLTMTNHEDEWSVAYHGTKTESLKSIIPHEALHPILKGGVRQAYKNSINKNKRSDTYGKECGEGVYCTPIVGLAENYASGDTFDGKVYKIVLQCRINPKKFRDVGNSFYVTNSEDIRPYGILYKITESKKTEGIPG